MAKKRGYGNRPVGQLTECRHLGLWPAVVPHSASDPRSPSVYLLCPRKRSAFRKYVEVSNKSELCCRCTAGREIRTGGHRMLPILHFRQTDASELGSYVDAVTRERPIPGRSRPTDDSIRGQRMIQVTHGGG